MAAVKTDKYTKMEKVVWKYSGIIIRSNIVRSDAVYVSCAIGISEP